MEKKVEKWTVRNWGGNFDKIASECQVSKIIARLAVNRNISEEAAYEYFRGTLDLLEEPALMKDLEKAAKLLEQAMEAGGKIAVASDYDTDGLFSGFSLYRMIEILGGESVIYTPNRITEGYGLNQRIVDDARADGCALLITCDNGIAANEPVSYAKEHGVTVIVTDHHDVPYAEDENGVRTHIIPKADAIVNPKQEDCPYRYKELCGTGIVFQLARYLFAKHGVSEDYVEELLSYAAMATVADVMDLTGENRMIVKKGLSLLKNTRNLGLKAMIEACGLSESEIKAWHIGFVLAPCFNAAGRLQDIQRATELLMETDVERARQKAEELKNLNAERQKMTEDGVTKAIELLEGLREPEEENRYMGDKVVFVCLKELHESVAGIVAGRLRERYAHPIFVLTESSDGGYKGSGRSTEKYHMFDGLMKAKELLGRFGGHPMAAGISVSHENYEALKHQINEQCELTEEDFIDYVRLDMELPFRYISEDLINELSLLEPFGKGNPSPEFGAQNIKILRYQVVGKNKNVMKFLFEDGQGFKMDGICFGEPEDFEKQVAEKYGDDVLQALKRGARTEIKLLLRFSPQINDYQGNRTVQLHVSGVKSM